MRLTSTMRLITRLYGIWCKKVRGHEESATKRFDIKLSTKAKKFLNESAISVKAKEFGS